MPPVLIASMKDRLANTRSVTSNTLLILTAIFLIAFANLRFFINVTEIYPVSLENIGFLASLAWGFGGAIILLLSLVCWRYTLKPVVIACLLISSMAAYFMDSYNTILDDSMIQNILRTDSAESLDLLSIKLFLYLLFLGILPAIAVFKTPIAFGSGGRELVSRIKLFVIILVCVAAFMLPFSDFYTSFFREHKPLRFYANPTYYTYSTGKYIHGLFHSAVRTLKPTGTDAHSLAAEGFQRKLIIFVVGEAARADHFSLNGYQRETNPLLKKEKVITFTDVWSCGTSTAVSVPCMFSFYTSREFTNAKGKSTENVMDVLAHAGVNLLWLDNNSDSKGVADRIDYQSYKSPDTNPVCDVECRDEGMLENLHAFIADHPRGDLFVVLHQMGNHGPAYSKRYPAEFEQFTPVCKTNLLENCDTQELINAYDNAILYTDFFLSRVIGLLKTNSREFETAMFYVGDHGESLGENGLYLHGIPNFIAPDSQRHVPFIFWASENFKGIDMKSLAEESDAHFTHDNMFHTILGSLGIETAVYDQRLDILHPTR